MFGLRLNKVGGPVQEVVCRARPAKARVLWGLGEESGEASIAGPSGTRMGSGRLTTDEVGPGKPW